MNTFAQNGLRLKRRHRLTSVRSFIRLPDLSVDRL